MLLRLAFALTPFASVAAAAQPVQVPVPDEVPDRRAPNGFLYRPVAGSALSLVIADTVTQTEPRRLCMRVGCRSIFKASFRDAVTLAGELLPHDFAASLEMGSPYPQSYRLALVVERRPGQALLVRASRGFHYLTKLACFENGELRGIA